MQSKMPERGNLSAEYCFAADIVECINYHFSQDIGWVYPCPKRDKITLLTPPLEKLFIKFLFYARKNLIKEFYYLYYNTQLILDVLKKFCEDRINEVASLINERIRYSVEQGSIMKIIGVFFKYCIRVAGYAVLFHRGGKAPGSLETAISAICSIIKTYQGLTYFNDNFWNELTNQGQKIERLHCSDFSLGLEPFQSGENSEAFFKFIEPNYQANLSSSSANITPVDYNYSELKKSLTLEQMIAIATHSTENVAINQISLNDFTDAIMDDTHTHVPETTAIVPTSLDVFFQISEEPDICNFFENFSEEYNIFMPDTIYTVSPDINPNEIARNDVVSSGADTDDNPINLTINPENIGAQSSMASLCTDTNTNYSNDSLQFK